MKKVSIKTINIISIIIPIAVAFLFKLQLPLGNWTKILPHVNAFINSSTAVLLIVGLVMIKNGNIELHKKIMSLAFALGALFLVTYVLYHISNEEVHYGGETGFSKYFYFFILISHILCSLIVLPFVLRAYYFGLRRMDSEHRRITKLAYPLWLYVSITGVIAYIMISPYYT